VNTKLQIYELPDWQNVTLDLQITARCRKLLQVLARLNEARIDSQARSKS